MARRKKPASPQPMPSRLAVTPQSQESVLAAAPAADKVQKTEPHQCTTREEYWTVVTGISSIVQGICVIVSLVLIFWQVYKDHDQRKKAATMQHIASMAYDKQRDMKLCGTNDDGELIPMTYERAKIVNKDSEMHAIISKLLAEMEFYATGVNMDVFDLEVAIRLNGGYVIAQYTRYFQYIQFLADLQDDVSYKLRQFDQFERLAFRFNELRPPPRALTHVNRAAKPVTSGPKPEPSDQTSSTLNSHDAKP